MLSKFAAELRSLSCESLGVVPTTLIVKISLFSPLSSCLVQLQVPKVDDQAVRSKVDDHEDGLLYLHDLVIRTYLEQPLNRLHLEEARKIHLVDFCFRYILHVFQRVRQCYSNAMAGTEVSDAHLELIFGEDQTKFLMRNCVRH